MVFDELRSWYGEQKLIQVEGEKEDMQENDVQQEPQVMSGPSESSHTPSKNVSPWSGRLRQTSG